MQSENLDLAFQTGESVGIPATLVRPTFKLTGLTTGNFTCILLVLTRHHEHGTQLLGTYGRELDLWLKCKVSLMFVFVIGALRSTPQWAPLNENRVCPWRRVWSYYSSTVFVFAWQTVEEMLRPGGPDWQRVLGYVESMFRHFEMWGHFPSGFPPKLDI